MVGIQNSKVTEMYTGTLINDLMAAGERAGRRARQQQIAEQIAEQRELHEIFAMQISVADGDQVYMGAA
ncbi:MAG: hypothetical protein DMG79_05125 [Acidobacteria bacterium]|nr:MAG: hypothetical protein DMG79_05125 [Acidobacteriota bacterium]